MYTGSKPEFQKSFASIFSKSFPLVLKKWNCSQIQPIRTLTLLQQVLVAISIDVRHGLSEFIS